MRALLLIHRYLGTAIGLVMAMWCASGIVMLYVSFPALDSEQRLRSLEPVTWHGCCANEKIASALGVDVADDFTVEMVAGRPVLTVSMAVGNRQSFDLQSGESIDVIEREQALAVASRHAQAMGITQTPQYQALIERDQWTVQGQFNRDRPLHHIAFGDEHGTELYVSNTGQVVQHTTTRQRFWNWLGAVPHWLYPTLLRQHAALWAQVVIWLSLAGVFLTVIGLYIGVAHTLAMKGKRWSPYRGVSLWHHLSGLFFGVLTLTWVVSGLVSMSPWGLFEGTGFKAERDRVRDVWIDGRQITATMQALSSSSTLDAVINDTGLRSVIPAQAGIHSFDGEEKMDSRLRGNDGKRINPLSLVPLNAVTRIESAPLNGKLYLLVYNGAQTLRLDAKTLQPAPLQKADIERAATQLVDDEKTQIDFLSEGDHYYYSGHESRSLPVYRVSVDNADHTRYYLDPNTADIVFKAGSDERWYRWLFEGLHRWDFSAWLRQRPWWDLLIVPLMLGVTLTCFTGVYMGYRRLMPNK